MELAIEHKPKDDNLVALIDADMIAYNVSYGQTSKAAVRSKIAQALTDILEDTGTLRYIMLLSGKDNFRNDVAELKRYKGNRYDAEGKRISPQPDLLQYARETISENYTSFLCECEEADDTLSYLQYGYMNEADGNTQSIICTGDKDLWIVPGLHYNLMTKKIDNVTKLGDLWLDKKGKLRGTGLKFFYAQMLMGDSTDHIPGLPLVTEDMVKLYGCRRGGCGGKSAYQVLQECTSERMCITNVLFCYASFYGQDEPMWAIKRKQVPMEMTHWNTGEELSRCPLDRMTEQGQLLWMRSVPNEMWEVPNRETYTKLLEV